MIEVWPVIHVSPSCVTRSAVVAERCGCAGVMLISMTGHNDLLLPAATLMRHKTEGRLKIGVNFLGMYSADALLRSQMTGFDATWTDRQEFSRGELSSDAKSIRARIETGHHFFAAVAFKGQPPDPFPADSARLAAWLGVIPTTSGPSTGVAPDVEKIAAIRKRLEPGDPLAIASGLTPENAASFAPYITHALVNTGISKNDGELDEDRLRALMDAFAPWTPEGTHP